jgi:hypothetical protein
VTTPRTRRPKVAPTEPDVVPGAAAPAAETPEPVPAAETPEPTPARVMTLRLPLVTAIVRVPPAPHLPHVGRRELAEAATTARSFLPPPRKLLFYGGPGALALLEVIEWPVAVVVAAATVMADGERHRDPDRVFLPARQDAAPQAAAAV